MKTTWRMEMESASDFVPTEPKGETLTVTRVRSPYGELSKFLHTLVGHPWRWGGREGWGKRQWTDYVMQPGFEMWLGLYEGAPAGYSELIKHDAGDVQIKTMGLAPPFIGKGLGGQLLTRTVERAWELTSRTVWLSTCSHDHPKARANYEARGFKVVALREEEEENPEIPSFWELVDR